MKITHHEFAEIVKNAYESVYGEGAWESLPKQERDRIVCEHEDRDADILDFED